MALQFFRPLPQKNTQALHTTPPPHTRGIYHVWGGVRWLGVYTDRPALHTFLSPHIGRVLHLYAGCSRLLLVGVFVYICHNFRSMGDSPESTNSCRTHRVLVSGVDQKLQSAACVGVLFPFVPKCGVGTSRTTRVRCGGPVFSTFGAP